MSKRQNVQNDAVAEKPAANSEEPRTKHPLNENKKKERKKQESGFENDSSSGKRKRIPSV